MGSRNNSSVHSIDVWRVVAGYFCYRNEKYEFARRLRKQITKLALLYVFTNLLFFCITYYLSGASSLKVYEIMQFQTNAWKDFILVNQSPFAGHLWFLGSMLYAMLIMLFIYIMHFVIVLYFYQKYASYAPDYIMNFGTVIIFATAMVGAELWNLTKSLVTKAICMKGKNRREH